MTKTKNKMLKLGILMFGIAAVTTFAIGGTLAKYVTDGTNTASASVAKWGITVNTTAASETFKTEYATDDTTVKDTIASSVVSGSDPTKNIIAPGTSGTLATSTVFGTAEVAVSVSRTATVTLENWTVNIDGVESEYCPIVFVVKTGSNTVTYKMGATKDVSQDDVKIYNTIKDLTDALETAFADSVANYAPNAQINDSSDVTCTWSWAFEDTSAGAYQDNKKDTALAELTTLPSITIAMTTTVTQID